MDGFIDGLSNGWFIRSEADFQWVVYPYQIDIKLF